MSLTMRIFTMAAILLCLVVCPITASEFLEAVRQNNLTSSKKLLSKQPGLINENNANGQSPLHIAAKHDFDEMAEFLLEHGADVDAEGIAARTPLHLAALNGSLAVAETLISRSDALNTKDRGRFYTPLHMAAANDHPDIITLLIRNGARIEPKTVGLELTPLHLAAQLGQKEAIETLINEGADPNVTDKLGRTPLHFACLNQNADTIQLLIREKGNPYAKAYTPIFGRRWLGGFLFHNGKLIVPRLGQNKVLVPHRYQNGRQPMHFAAKTGNKGAIDALLAVDSSAKIADADGFTPIVLAAIRNQESTVIHLRDEMTTPYVDKDGYQLMRAITDFKQMMGTSAPELFPLLTPDRDGSKKSE